MAEFPSLNLWTDAYLSDTRHLNTLEHGAYLLLLMGAWRRPHCDLPDDDLILSRLAGLRPDEWTEIKPMVMAFWALDGRSKTWKQKRLTLERDAARKRSRSQADKAAKRWDKKEKDNAPASATAHAGDIPTIPITIAIEEPNGSPSPPTPKAKRGVRKAGNDHPLPEGWKPNLGPKVLAMVASWPSRAVEREEDAFRYHAATHGRLAKNWDAAFAMWLTKADERRSQNGNQQSGNYAPRDNRDGVAKALDGIIFGDGPVEPSGTAGRRDAGDGGGGGQVALARPSLL